MVSEGNRIIELAKYLSTLGISVNIGKNKARGHKGFFMHCSTDYRIDISKDISHKEILSTLLHEFAHFVHYKYDKCLKSLAFVFDGFSDDLREELIKITVLDISKDFASKLYDTKKSLREEIRVLNKRIKSDYPDFKMTEKNNKIEKNLPPALRYLLRYDNVRYNNKVYSVNKINELSLDDIEKDYIVLKSKQRAIKRINSRIARLNRYYNNPSELFARFVNLYYTNPEMTKKLAPKSYEKMKNSNIELFEKIDKIFS